MYNIGLVVSEFNSTITNEMEQNILENSKRLGVKITKTLRVPGVFDTPLAAKFLLKNQKIDAVIALGVVIEGETKHDELVANNAARTLTDLSLEFEKPVLISIIGPGASLTQANTRAKDYSTRALEGAIKMLNELHNL